MNTWLKGLLAVLLVIPALAYGAITADQKYILNSQMGAAASKVQLGTLVDAADTVVSADITDGTIVAADIATSGVATAEILDGTILNADVDAAAAIDSTKLAGWTHTAETIVGIEHMAMVTYVFATDAGGTGTVSLGVTLPDNAIVTKVIQDIVVDCDSTADTGTIKLVLPTDGDLSTAVTCDNTNAGVTSELPSGTPIKLTAARALSATIATNAVLVGTIRWFVYYVQSI